MQRERSVRRSLVLPGAPSRPSQYLGKLFCSGPPPSADNSPWKLSESFVKCETGRPRSLSLSTKRPASLTSVGSVTTTGDHLRYWSLLAAQLMSNPLLSAVKDKRSTIDIAACDTVRPQHCCYTTRLDLLTLLWWTGRLTGSTAPRLP